MCLSLNTLIKIEEKNGDGGVGDDDVDETENNVVMLCKRELFDQRETRPTVRNQPFQG